MQSETVQPDNVDEMVWHRFKTGSEHDFALLFERYSTPLLKYGLTLEADRDRVKDAIQELFIGLWQQRQQVAEVRSVRFYLLSSLRRALLRQKATDRRLRHDQTAYIRSTDGWTSPADHQLLTSEQCTTQEGLLARAVNDLPKRQREAIFLRFYEALPYDDIAVIMSLGYQVVRNLVHRAVKTLRQQLSRFHPIFFRCPDTAIAAGMAPAVTADALPLSKDILMMTRVDKPALVRRLFELGCSYSGQILSYTKLLGQLQDADNTTTLTHYAQLLDSAGLLSGLDKYAVDKVRQRGLVPKWQVQNSTLFSVFSPLAFE